MDGGASLGRKEEEVSSSLLALPDDVLFIILSFCDLQSLGRLARVCRPLNRLVKQECVWIWMSKRLTVVHDCRLGKSARQQKNIRVRELCRRATNWRRGHGRDIRQIQHTVKQLPWLQRDDHYFWISYKNMIRCYIQCHHGHLQEVPNKRLPYHRDDVCRFVSKEGCILSGSRDGGMCLCSTETGDLVWSIQHAHTSDIQAVDFHHNIAVSGSRDSTLKIWDMTSEDETGILLQTIVTNDRVWSLAMSPDGRSFLSGTAGINYVPPLRMWDTQTGQLVGNLGDRYKNGAGVLDIQYETNDILLSCGYDTLIRMWDLRCSVAKCVKFWEEPFDSTIYCVRTDHHNAIMSGTARHGLVRLWDKRMTEHVQMYYTGKSSSPVYAMAFDTAHLYVALDKGINMIDFSLR